MSSEIRHFSHDHPLRRTRVIFVQHICNLCNRLISERKKYYCYECSRCRYRIDTGCAELPEHINCHSLHPLHALMITKRSSLNVINSCFCYYCEKPFRNDEYLYACRDQLCSGFYMHMTCALIPLPTISTSTVDGGKDHGVVSFFCHQQPMILVHQNDHDSNKRGAKCFGCQSYWSGPAYSCISKSCDNFLHKSCAELPQKIQHPFHSLHSLILQISKPQSCHSCCKKDCRLTFSCLEDGCNFVLCVECASLDTILNCQSHDHLLSLVEKSSCKIQCDACQISYESEVKAAPKEVTHTRSFIFRCMYCVFNLHFLCGPLPSIIMYEYHMHPLFLSNHLVSKDNSDEYYCDVCEEERDQSFRIYYCKECKYVAHIHCLIYKIMKLIKGDSKDVELKAVGENRWDALDHQSSGLLTLKDIMNQMLTPKEKEMLIDPFTFDNPPEKSYWVNAYNHYRRFNSRFDLEGSIEEDIGRIRRFFKFKHLEADDDEFVRLLVDPDVDDFGNFQMELRYFTPERGLLKFLEDKYLRQKVENVDGYIVPKTLAPILKTLLRKYGGDLCGRESLTPAMKSITLSLLCIVIDKMCRIKIEDITRDDVKHVHFCLKGIQEITGFRLDRYLDCFEDIIKVFLGFEAIRYEKDMNEKLDQRMATLEAEMEKCKKNREKVKIYASDKSKFMNECSTKASECRKLMSYWGDKWF